MHVCNIAVLHCGGCTLCDFNDKVALMPTRHSGRGATCCHTGAVYYQGSLGANSETLYVEDCTFMDNNASSGGALCPWGVSFVTIKTSRIQGNHAYYGRGGGMYTYGESCPASTDLPWEQKLSPGRLAASWATQKLLDGCMHVC